MKYPDLTRLAQPCEPARHAPQVAVQSQRVLRISTLKARLVRQTPQPTRKDPLPKAEWYIQLSQVIPRGMKGTNDVLPLHVANVDLPDEQLVGLVEVPLPAFLSAVEDIWVQITKAVFNKA